jgi:ribosomal-protein-alanine N-acetyltransferase
MTKHKSFETNRLLLHPTSEKDADFLLQLMNMPKWIQYIGDRNVRTIEQAKAYVREKMQPQLDRLGFANYTLIRKEDQHKIGTCGLYDREGLAGVDIGFALLPDYEGQGYAFEAAHRLQELAFSEFGLSSIQAITTKDNLASQRLLEKLGLQRTGTTRIPNDPEELWLYKIKKP